MGFCYGSLGRLRPSHLHHPTSSWFLESLTLELTFPFSSFGQWVIFQTPIRITFYNNVFISLLSCPSKNQWRVAPTPAILHATLSALQLRPSSTQPSTHLFNMHFQVLLVLPPNQATFPRIKRVPWATMPLLLLFLLPPRATKFCQNLFQPLKLLSFDFSSQRW